MINLLIGQKLFSFSFRRFGFSLLIFINLILSPIENIGFAVSDDDDGIFDSATIGPELTFTNPILKQNWMKRMELYYYFKVFTFGLGHLKGNGSFQKPTKNSELAWATILKEAILKSCNDCSLETEKGKFGLPHYRITFPNQYWIVVATDPQVVELQTKPLTLNEYRELEPYIQTHIYNIAADIGLYPTTNTDGNSNIGVKSAFSNVKELANFYLDTYNHPELAFGVLGFDTHNAPSLLLQTQPQINALKTVLKEIELDEIVDFEGFAKAINYRVYYRSKDFRKKSSGRHYQGFSLKRLLSEVFQVEDLPLEIRFTASRPDFQMVILNYELILKRIQFLKKSEFKNIMLYHNIDPNFDLEMSESEQLSRFFIYVTEMGEDFNRYKPLIYNYNIFNAGLDNFTNLNSKYFEFPLEILRYVKDLQTSQWVRDRMLTILSFNIAEPLRNRIIIEINKLMNDKNTSPIGSKVLSDFLKQIESKLNINTTEIINGSATHHCSEVLNNKSNFRRNIFWK